MGVFQTNELAEDCTGMINNTVESVLKGKYPGKTISFCAKLEMYKETPIFITVNVTEEAV